MKSRKYINKDGVTKCVTPSKIDEYLSSGWQIGRISGNQSGKKAITRNGINKYVYESEIDSYLSDGWVFGQRQNHKKPQ